MVSDYNRERHEAFVRRSKRADSIVLSDINETIRRTMDSCRLDASAWASSYADGDIITLADARRVASRSDIDTLNRKSKFYIDNRSDTAIALSKKAIQDEKYSMVMNRLELLQESLKINLYSMTDDLAVKTYSHITKETIEELRRQAGILGETVPSPERLRAQAEVIANASFHDQSFSDRIWDNQDQLRANLYDGIQRSLMMGQHPTSWMDTLSGLFQAEFIGTHDRGGMDYAMQRIAVTEVARCQVASQLSAYTSAGYSRLEVITEQSACPEICKPLDGGHVDVESAEIGLNVPPFHPNCRCGTGALSHRIKK